MATVPPSVPSSERTFLIAVAGNPNSGKTTLFNGLTGLRHRVGNYPGVTVEKREGVVAGAPGLRLLDLPGTYSLSARSPDEQIARDALLGLLADTPRPDAALVVVDGDNLERNLYLATQIIELGIPAVVACNMMDRVQRAGHRLDLEKLSGRLGVTVVPTVGHRGEGIDAVRAALEAACEANAPPVRRAWSLGEPFEREVARLAEVLAEGGYADGPSAPGAALLLLSEGSPPASNHLPAPVRESLAAGLDRLAREPDLDVALDVTAARYAWLGEVVDACLVRADTSAASATDRLDRVLTHKQGGPLILATVVAGVFFSIFSLAEPIMNGIDVGVTWARDLATARLSPSTFRDLLVDGILAGVGNVIVFLPQICILFLAIALLEDSGYMARAAFMMDRLMSRVGLHGKSFIPLLCSHACAVPGIMATRTIENPKDRLVTILVAPLMSCSARLPVYAVLITACLGGGAWVKTSTMLGAYGLGIVAALAMATLFKKTLLKGPSPAFLMELPPYRVPRAGAVLRVVWDRSRAFITRAGTIILAITIVLWALMNYPTSGARDARYDTLRKQIRADAAPSADTLERRLQAIDDEQAADDLAHSIAGRLGRLIEPAIKPLGYDWRIGIGLVSSFAAREVFVSTMGVVFSVGEDADESSASLRKQIQAAAWPDGRKVFTPLTAVSLLVFYVLACQCASTLAIVRRETNSWRWPLFLFGYMTALAYTASLLVYQIGSVLNLGTA